MKKSRFGWWRGTVTRGRGAKKQMVAAAKLRRQKRAKR